jgi:hypothetical protein
VQALENLKNGIKMLRGNSNTIIFYIKLQPVLCKR